MDGIFLVNKDKDWTSRDVVNYIGHHFQMKKVGHVGTLDPFATGLLIILVGKATKILPYLENQNKKYRATLKLGEDTDTLDLEGKVTKTLFVPTFDEKKINEVLNSFLGDIEQSIPMYSAVKYQGRELYKYARENIDIPTMKRVITIKSISLVDFDKDTITFDVECSKGTYIRQLGYDIAHKLSTCGHLIALKRLEVGAFNLDSSHQVKEIKEEHLISIKDALSYFPMILVNEIEKKMIINGRILSFDRQENLLLAIDNIGTAFAILEKTPSGYRTKRGLF